MHRLHLLARAVWQWLRYYLFMPLPVLEREVLALAREAGNSQKTSAN